MVTDRPAQCMFCEKREEAYAVARKIVTEQQLQIASLRAALELFACDCKDSGNLCASPQNCRNYIARSALEGKHE